MTTELACRSACESAAACKSYTWTPGPSAPRKDCEYTHQCWWRDDSVWDLKNTNKCDGRSGFKGVPAPGPPAPAPGPPAPAPGPPGPPPPPAPPGALNVLFVIFDDLRVMHEPWGFKQTHTPNTNALANRSLVFDNAYCQRTRSSRSLCASSSEASKEAAAQWRCADRRAPRCSRAAGRTPRRCGTSKAASGRRPVPRPGTPGQSGSASTATTRRAWASCKSRHAIAAIWVAFFSRWQRYGQVPPWRPEGFRPAELDGRCAASPRLSADLPVRLFRHLCGEDLSARRLCSPACALLTSGCCGRRGVRRLQRPGPLPEQQNLHLTLR